MWVKSTPSTEYNMFTSLILKVILWLINQGWDRIRFWHYTVSRLFICDQVERVSELCIGFLVRSIYFMMVDEHIRFIMGGVVPSHWAKKLDYLKLSMISTIFHKPLSTRVPHFSAPYLFVRNVMIFCLCLGETTCLLTSCFWNLQPSTKQKRFFPFLDSQQQWAETCRNYRFSCWIWDRLSLNPDTGWMGQT